MTDNCIKLFCLVDGEALSNAFPVEIESSKTIGDLKEAIKSKKKNDFQKIDANKLILQLVSIPDGSQQSAITLKALDDKTGLDNPRELISERFPESPDVKTYILVQRPTPELDLPASKKIRLTEGWKQSTASDGTAVALPPSWIDILASTDFVPEPRAAFNHLKKDLQAGDSILVPSMGQTPKDFERHGLDHRFFITEQMLGLWEDMRGDQKLTYRHPVRSNGAYAEGWLVLYLSDTKVLDRDDENESALALVKRFLALNKDILTGAEMEMLIHMYNGTAHAKYEMKILHSSFLPTSVVYVGPLSENVFSKLLDTYPTLAAPAIQKQVTEITGRVPRELMHLSDTVDPITSDNLQEWAESRIKYFLHIAREYHQSRSELGKQVFYRALLTTFLGGKNAVDYEWDFVDLGLIYRSKEIGQIGTQYYILCHPSQKALLELFKTLPQPEET
ncbi:hypothetical protein BGX24_002966 [Mortierella sp. AD032]|nr:hypothetical protein BGX24_002966 [Mortierella sp. AD032]